MAVTPPAAIAAMAAPSSGRRRRGDMRARRRIIQRTMVMQRAGYRTRRQRMVNGVGAQCALAARIATGIVGCIGAETAAAGRARE